jgi:ferredoxin
MALTIDPEICPANHRCPLINICPMDAISQINNGLPIINEDTCAGCMDCIGYCPLDAVQQN